MALQRTRFARRLTRRYRETAGRATRPALNRGGQGVVSRLDRIRLPRCPAYAATRPTLGQATPKASRLNPAAAVYTQCGPQASQP